MTFGPEPPRCEWCGLRWAVHIALGCPDRDVRPMDDHDDEEREP